MSPVDLKTLSRTGSIHFMGVGGAGMCALAEVVLRSGGSVSGCDVRPGPSTERLEGLGAPIHEGHDPAHVGGVAALVVSAAVPGEHAEIRAARASGIPVLKRASALGAWVEQGTVVAVAGTHGKTSTTAMVTEVLAAAGLDPTGFVGGQVAGWGGNLRFGRPDLFVVEADEYDRSFHALRPHVAVVTNVEADHLDVYGSLAGVREAFDTFLDGVSPEGRIVVCGDDPEASRLLTAAGARGYAYGLNAGLQLRAVDVRQGAGATTFGVEEEGKSRGEVRLRVPGLHNVRNALAAAAAARHLNVAWEAIVEGLEGFGGVKRRFERLGSAAGITVVDDYAHHPTEVRATLDAARAFHPGARIVAVFQPHLYTRTRDFHREFADALSRADEVWVTDVYPAREEPIAGVTGALIVEGMREARTSTAIGENVAGEEAAVEEAPAKIEYHPSLDGLAEAVATSLREGDVCLTLGAGSIETVAPAILERLTALQDTPVEGP